jgi:hypothetical protein
MSGYSKLYCVGEKGGCAGADGMNPIHFQILVGDADRQWLEVHYLNRSLKPLGKIRAVIPKGPDIPDSLIDACIVFYPEHFKKCPSFKSAQKRVKRFKRLDFHLKKKEIPAEWVKLREEARGPFKKLFISEAILQPMGS